MKKLYVIEMTKAGKKSYVSFSYDIIWCQNFYDADFYETPEEAEKDIPELLKREKELEEGKLMLAAKGLYKLPENYQKPEISIKIREIEICLL